MVSGSKLLQGFCSFLNRVFKGEILSYDIYIVGYQGVVQLGGPDLWFDWGGPAKVGAC